MVFIIRIGYTLAKLCILGLLVYDGLCLLEYEYRITPLTISSLNNSMVNDQNLIYEYTQLIREEMIKKRSLREIAEEKLAFMDSIIQDENNGVTDQESLMQYQKKLERQVYDNYKSQFWSTLSRGVPKREISFDNPHLNHTYFKYSELQANRVYYEYLTSVCHSGGTGYLDKEGPYIERNFVTDSYNVYFGEVNYNLRYRNFIINGVPLIRGELIYEQELEHPGFYKLHVTYDWYPENKLEALPMEFDYYVKVRP